MNISVVLPSFNPDEKLLYVIESLVSRGFDDIIIVNDGSDFEHSAPFFEVEKHPQCTVLTHQVNKGKGRALKTAFEFFLKNRPEKLGVVTIDGDNQHHIDDIVACSKKMLESPNYIILGTRDFSQNNIPKRSVFGNKITSLVFKIACGIKISDTQTGLRAIPAQYLKLFLETQGERFEFETNMLLEMKSHSIPFHEVKIKTIYIEGNKSSHFNPIFDSLKIYNLIFKFFLSSIFSSVVDITTFAIITSVLRSALSKKYLILLATFVARLLSSLINFTLNRKTVFKTSGTIKATMSKYYILCGIQALTSFVLVYLFSEIFTINGGFLTVLKMIVDTILYFASFQIQREWVFKSHNKLS